MENFLPGVVMALREGLEAFLIVTIIVKFLEKTNYHHLKKYVGIGILISIILLSVIGLFLILGTEFLSNEVVGKLWESIFSLVAVSLVISFIIWIIQKGQNIKYYIESKTAINLSSKGIIVLTTLLMLREGIEVLVFAFAGQYQFFSVVIGVFLALLICVFIYYSLIKINLKLLFNLTLFYLILQSGYLFGYGIHEGLSALLHLGYLKENSVLLTKLFDFSKTILNSKEGGIGIVLNILFGWYSKPEWLQFVLQYLVTFGLFGMWMKNINKKVK